MDDEKFDLNSRIWVWFNSVLSYDNIIAHDFLNEIDGCATFADVIIGLAATLAAAAAAAAALIYRRRHAYPDPVPAGGEDDGYEEDAHEREYRDDIQVVKVPMTEIAAEYENPKGANIVMMGAMAANSDLFTEDDLERLTNEFFEKKGKINPKNSLCFRAGTQIH